MAMTEQEKKFALDSAIKVGLVIWGVSYIQKTLTFGKPGLTHRVAFDLEKTQNRYMPIGGGEYEIIPDPWLPNDIGRRAYAIMNGTTTEIEPHVNIYHEISQLGLDRTRWLHNYWLDQIDSKTTLYRWIDNEWINLIGVGSKLKEQMAKDNVMQNLRRWGVGF